MSTGAHDSFPFQRDVQAPGLSLSQQRVLERLKRTGAATIPALAGELSLNVETVRHHLRALVGLGYVERQGTRKPRAGRPEVVYTLTSQAERLFPSRQGEVLRGLAEYLRETGNASLIEEFFERWISSRRSAALARVQGLTGEPRLREVAAIMAELGFMSSVEVEGGSGQLHLRNCPLRDLVEVSKVPCRAEIAFIRRAPGGATHSPRLHPRWRHILLVHIDSWLTSVSRPGRSARDPPSHLWVDQSVRDDGRRTGPTHQSRTKPVRTRSTPGLGGPGPISLRAPSSGAATPQTAVAAPQRKVAMPSRQTLSAAPHRPLPSSGAKCHPRALVGCRVCTGGALHHGSR